MNRRMKRLHYCVEDNCFVVLTDEIASKQQPSIRCQKCFDKFARKTDQFLTGLIGSEEKP